MSQWEPAPRLKNVDIQLKARPSASVERIELEEGKVVRRGTGAPEFSFEERMRTSQGNYSLVVYDGGKAVIEFDGISLDGWIQEVKIEQKFQKLDDIVIQLRRQADFAEAYGLKGVEYSIESAKPELVDEVEAEVARQRLRNVHRIP